MWPLEDRQVFSFLAKASRGHFPRDVNAFGLEFTVHHGVFSPIMGCVPVHETLAPFAGRELLDVGCGVGVLAVVAAKQQAQRVVATDINPAAVTNTRANVLRHRVADRVEIRHGDLFEPIQENERFDIVFWNCPFHFAPVEAKLTMLERAAFDPGYRAIRRYFLEGHRYVKPDGTLFLQFSSAYGRWDLVQGFARESGLRMQVRRRWAPGEDTMIAVELLELQRFEAGP
jgi:release factor glutamine methyltransferase